MSSDVDGRSIKMGMILHPEGESSNFYVMAAATGKMGRAVGMMSMSEVGDGCQGRRHEPTGLGMVGHAATMRAD